MIAALGTLAYRALIAEVDATPKPGLVDRANSGAHRDMDHGTFLVSAAALKPYFEAFARIGAESADAPPEAVLPLLRPMGIEAEAAMFRATGGINTHKGAIFSLGLLSAAAARCAACSIPLFPETVAKAAASFVAGICARELGQSAATKGERAYLAAGHTGVRGEAEAGFPRVVEIALPAYRAMLARGASDNDALSFALLALIAAVPDTNIPTRLDEAAARHAMEAARRTMEEIHTLPPGGEEWLRRLDALDADFIARRISPGGSADLLAAAWYLHAVEAMGD